MPSRAGLVRSRLAHLGGFVVGAAISERLFGPPSTRASAFGSLVGVAKEEVAAVRWEIGRVNDARLARLTRRVVTADPGRWTHLPSRLRVTSGLRERP